MQRTMLGFSWVNFRKWRRQRHVQSTLTVGLIILGPLLAILTFLVLSPFEQGPNSPSLRLVLLADFVYVVIVASVVIQRVVRMVAARRARSAGSRLHLRITAAFTVLALVPTILVAVFAMLTVNIGLEGWFSDRVRNVVENSLAAAEAYETEQRDGITTDTQVLMLNLAAFLRSNTAPNDGELRQELQRLQPQIQRGFSKAFIVDGTGVLRARGVSSYSFNYDPPSEHLFETARAEGIAVYEDWPNNEFRALVPINGFVNRYLWVSRTIDGNILNLLDDTQETVILYQQLDRERGRYLFEFGVLYLGFAVILILAATWAGLWFAERLSRPIGRLAGAAQRVGSGDLNVRVREEDGDDEIAMLGRYFNQMTSQLHGQRETLLSNTDQIARRGRVFDSVLNSVSSGVVGLSEDGDVTFVNTSARRLLDVTDDDTHEALELAVPEFSGLFNALKASGAEVVQEEIKLVRNGAQENLLVRMSPRKYADGVLEGYVVAFDDVTDLVSAQRTAAWGDVARRIAHEIKNPLTPIQLSAERVKRKFSKEVEDPASLAQLTDVIVRQTNDLRRIVDEFSKFARMPEPERRDHDIVKLVRDIVVLQDSGDTGVTVTADTPDEAIHIQIDDTMISQSLTNLIKNAGEAIETRIDKQKLAPDFAGKVHVTLDQIGDTVVIEISDNGIGLPADRSKLFEPYVTTREKGTGLGLPIVKKIIEEHGGTLVLVTADAMDDTGHLGAKAVIKLPHDPNLTFDKKT